MTCIAVLRMVTYINWPNSSNSNINVLTKIAGFSKNWIVFVIKLQSKVEFSQSIHQRRYFMWSRQCKCFRPQTVKNIHYNQTVKAKRTMNKNQVRGEKYRWTNRPVTDFIEWEMPVSLLLLILAYHLWNIIFI